jgi:hypothetical protein
MNDPQNRAMTQDKSGSANELQDLAQQLRQAAIRYDPGPR